MKTPLSAFFGQEDRGFADFEKTTCSGAITDQLDERQREVIRLRFFEGKGQREVRSISACRNVSRIERTGARFLREALTEGESSYEDRIYRFWNMGGAIARDTSKAASSPARTSISTTLFPRRPQRWRTTLAAQRSIRLKN